jgi:Ca-activated chloride channel family protein
MNRARIVFIAIVGLTICGILSAVVVDRFFQQNSEPTSVTDSQATPLPADALPILIASSNTKEDWLNTVADQFNNENHQTSDGQRIVVQVQHVTSGGSMNAILDGTLQPIAWSPGDGSWADQANATWQQRTNKPIASQACTPTIYAPLGFAMWRPMAEALGWHQQPIGWDTIVALAANPDGWGAYGRPEWGQFTFGHTHPAYANSGLLSMTSFVYGVADVPAASLTPADVYSDSVTQAMQQLEQNTAKYGRQAPALLELMAQNGTSYLHAAAVPEAEVVRFNATRADELEFPLAFIFPSAGTIWADHPYCILDNADWVDGTEAEAGQLFLDYLLDTDQQSLAIDNYLRPLDSNIPLRSPMSLEFGTDPTVTVAKVPAFPSPSAELSEAIIDQFFLTKRKATIIVVLDVSGSMAGDKIKTARTATAEFLQRLHPDDEVAVLTFSDNTVVLSEPARVGDVVETLSNRVSTITTDGNTSLYDAVCNAAKLAQTLQTEDIANGESRLYGVVLLSDGEDTVGQPSAGQMFATCLPNNAEANGVKIFPIAFGDSADTNTLERIASVTGGSMFTADPASITRAYESISAEQ